METKQINSTPKKHGWQFWIDVGGTFTDCLAQGPDGQVYQAKVLSSGCVKGRIHIDPSRQLSLRVKPGYGAGFWSGAAIRFFHDSTVIESSVESYDSGTGEIVLAAKDQLDGSAISGNVSFELDHHLPAPILAIRRILNCSPAIPLPDCSVHLGTTRGTNALLTRTGAKTALITTIGFRDLLQIGDQARPHLFELTINKPSTLFETAIEIDERILADGSIEKSPDVAQVRKQLVHLKSSGIESVAICLMHGFQYPEHESLIGEIAASVGFENIRLSSDVAPLIKILSRGETTVLDAYLNPVLSSYLDEIRGCLSPQSELKFLTSAGGLVDPDRFSGKDSVLSGPAGGIVGAARVAEQAGYSSVITFDMGGTSSDVGRYNGEIVLEFETQKSDVRILTPVVSIETVAAGGGSICRFDGAKLTVGPQSASSDPGPACYGKGGPLTVTDVNLFLGRILKDRFPFPLDVDAVESRLEEVRCQAKMAGYVMSLHELAAGFLEIANQNMASAIGSVSIARGYDPKDHLLVAFGGAGPQHCCAVAEAIGIERILDPPQGSILSAVGIRLADQTASRARSLMQPLNEDSIQQAETIWTEMETEIKGQLGEDSIELSRGLDLRYVGTDACQTINGNRIDEFVTRFEKQHHQLFGFTSNRPLEAVAVRVEGRMKGKRLSATNPIETPSVIETSQYCSTWQNGPRGMVECQTAFFARDELRAGDQILGPALVAGELSTTIIDSGWCATVLSEGQLLIERDGSGQFNSEGSSETPIHHELASLGNTPDPVQLEIFNNHFSTIARQMGISLQRTSMSVNVKERLDFSCAIFTRDGDLVVNAPHIPVHLGAMSETVRGIIRLNEHVHAGDVFVTNDPFAGGSHLPDVTVITPVFDHRDQDLIFWVASRSHHAEIGGISPGSMPPSATNLAEEGVLIRNFRLIDGATGQEYFDQLYDLLTAPPYPSRSPNENLADIRAQVAANQAGRRDLLALVDRHSLETVIAYMGHIQSAAEDKVRASIEKMKDGSYCFEDQMDNGATIRVHIEIAGDTLEIDFAGTDPVLPGNLNANPAIVRSAIIYVMRCLIQEDIPLNEGVMNPVLLKLDECFLNPASHKLPEQCPATVGGNVETSQRIVDVLIGALQPSLPETGLAAASQGTMNNWLMGNSRFGYYETLGGGSGATADSPGCDAVHTHMTNTRMTDPEVLETRYPVILRELSIRKHSGGRGRHVGGNGMIREIEFLEPLTVSLLTNRRKTQPYGALGGQSGTAGKNEIVLVTGEMRTLPGTCEIEVYPGDRLRIETPGGGGWGSSHESA